MAARRFTVEYGFPRMRRSQGESGKRGIAVDWAIAGGGCRCVDAKGVSTQNPGVGGGVGDGGKGVGGGLEGSDSEIATPNGAEGGLC